VLPRIRDQGNAMVLDLLGLAVFYYVVFDGFDLGVGMLYGLAPDEAGRSIIMNSIAPIWDGNETWLVFGGLGLLAAFPLAFTIIIPAVYFPILIRSEIYDQFHRSSAVPPECLDEDILCRQVVSSHSPLPIPHSLGWDTGWIPPGLGARHFRESAAGDCY
jgi:hypothetical protein